jgi:hypothetical protein
MYIGDVELHLGMSREAVMKALTPRYNVAALGESSFTVTQYDPTQKLHNLLGSIGFDNNQLSFINRSIDTSGWPNDEGYAVGRAIYDGISGSIPVTDSDDAKRAAARIVISSDDTSRPRGNMKTIDIYINDRKITVVVFDADGSKGVNASVAIRAKPW